MRLILRALLVLLPWSLRRRLLTMLYGYELDPTSHIGLAWVFPRHLVMAAHTSIGHLTVCVHLDRVELREHATLGRGNWVTGFPSGTDSPHFRGEPGRRSELILEEHSAMTNRHLIDATSPVLIGRFTTVAGFQSQILTHSIDLVTCRQASAPVSIGAYCFVGTNCVILGGSNLPERSVLGAKSLLNKSFDTPLQLYGGVPARAVKSLPPDAAYFMRVNGFVE